MWTVRCPKNSILLFSFILSSVRYFHASICSSIVLIGFKLILCQSSSISRKKTFFTTFQFNCNTKCIRNTCRTPTRHKFLASGSGRQPRPGLQRLQGHCLFDCWMKVLIVENISLFILASPVQTRWNQKLQPDSHKIA